MKIHFTFFTNFLVCTFLLAQTYNGKLGYATSPEGHPHNYSQFGPFLQEVANMCDGGVVMANGKWYDTITVTGNIPTLQKTVSQLQPVPYGYTDLLVFGWATYPVLYLHTDNNPVNNWTNTNMRAAFLQTLIRTADSLSPAYLFIGNEVNFYIEQDSSDYVNWCTFYSMAYDSIKAHSPNTKVGTVFNYEHLSGQGANIPWTAPHWNALLDMDTSKMDVVGLTLYPFLNYPNANAVATDYLDTLFTLIGSIPLVITETGWPGDSLTGTWSASPQEQVNWVNKLFPMIGSRNVEVTDWLFLNYMMDTSAQTLLFRSVSMRDSLGNDRPALATWLSYCITTSTVGPALSENGFQIYPNPANDFFTVQTSAPLDAACELTLIDLLGQEVRRIHLSSEKTDIATGDLYPGVYVCRITSNNMTVNTVRLIVN